MNKNSGAAYRGTSLRNGGRRAGAGVYEDDYSEESGGKSRGGSVKVHLPHDGVKPEDLAGQVVTIRLNPNADVAGIRQAIKDNDGYCPCAIRKIPDTKCMCKDFLENMGPGECHCGLYIKEIN